MSTKCQAASEKARAYSKTTLDPDSGALCSCASPPEEHTAAPEQDATTILHQFQM